MYTNKRYGDCLPEYQKLCCHTRSNPMSGSCRPRKSCILCYQLRPYFWRCTDLLEVFLANTVHCTIVGNNLPGCWERWEVYSISFKYSAWFQCTIFVRAKEPNGVAFSQRSNLPLRPIKIVHLYVRIRAQVARTIFVLLALNWSLFRGEHSIVFPLSPSLTYVPLALFWMEYDPGASFPGKFGSLTGFKRQRKDLCGNLSAM